jgi:hypothetical protein
MCIKPLLPSQMLNDIIQICKASLEEVTRRPNGLVSTGKGTIPNQMLWVCLVEQHLWNPWALCGGNKIIVPLEKGIIMVLGVSSNSVTVPGVEELGDTTIGFMGEALTLRQLPLPHSKM